MGPLSQPRLQILDYTEVIYPEKRSSLVKTASITAVKCFVTQTFDGKYADAKQSFQIFPNLFKKEKKVCLWVTVRGLGLSRKQ
jgi:hypothetical protein